MIIEAVKHMIAALSELQDIAKAILIGEDFATDEERTFVKGYIAKFGIDSVFISLDKAYPLDGNCDADTTAFAKARTDDSRSYSAKEFAKLYFRGWKENMSVDEKRRDYERFLKSAEQMLLSCPVALMDEKFVKKLAENIEWMDAHTTYPPTYFGFVSEGELLQDDIDEDEEELVDEDEEELVDEEEDIEGLQLASDNKELYDESNVYQIKEFGLEGECITKEFIVAKMMWDGKDIGEEWEYEPNVVADAAHLVVKAKLHSAEDLPIIEEVLSRALSCGDTDLSVKKWVSWLLADLYYVGGNLNMALPIYQTLAREEKGPSSRSVLISQIINVKRQLGQGIGVRDLIALQRPSDYNLRLADFDYLIDEYGKYVDMVYESWVLEGNEIDKVIDEASAGRKPYTCLYNDPTARDVLAKLGKDMRIPNIYSKSSELWGVIDVLYGELKYLDSKSRIKNIQNDLAEEADLYRKLRNHFKNEVVLFHHGTNLTLKYQISIFFPERRLGFEYRGAETLNENNYLHGEFGCRESLRKQDRARMAVEEEYNIDIKVISAGMTFDHIVSLVKAANKEPWTSPAKPL